MLLMTLVGLSIALAAPEASEEEEIKAQLRKACPGRAAAIDQASQDYWDKTKRPAALKTYDGLSVCGARVSILHRRLGLGLFESGDFVGAEAKYRLASSLSGALPDRIALLQALVRQKRSDEKGQAEMATLLAEAKSYSGDRPDIWANLSYLAYHFDDVPLMRRSSSKAIELGAQGWAPYFYSGLAEASDKPPNYKLALERLAKAEELGGPQTAIDKIRASVHEAMGR